MTRMVAALLTLLWSGTALAENPQIEPIYDDNGRVVGYTDTSREAHIADMTFNYCDVTDPRPYPQCFRKPDGGGEE